MLGRRYLAPALDFALGVMAILLVHEAGHYFVARYYKINASPPYFLPAPWPVAFVGTFGAFIRLRSPIVDRRQLLDIGAAGPWAGFIVAVMTLAVGLGQSSIAPVEGATEQFIVVGNDFRLFLGNSALMSGMRELFLGEGTVQLSPLAFAGWVGILVTMLNLLPLGQLDGGHVVYALFGEKQRVIGTAVWLSLFALGFLPNQWWWWVWAVLILLLGRGRLGHPQVLDRHRTLPKSRRPLGWATALLFLITFTPVPIHY
jgi:membrane-associated protease RseP (regulator of RpoE activity)